MNKTTINLLLVKVGAEPGFEEIPRRLKQLDARIRTFGVVSTPNQSHEFDVVVSSSYDSMLGAHPEYLRRGLYVRPELFESIAFAEGQIVRMFERVAIHDLSMVAKPGRPIPEYRDSVDDRVQLFLRQVGFWDYALREHQIDAVVAQNYGHNGFDAVLYEVAKANGLPYMFFHEFRPFRRAQQMYEHVSEVGSDALSIQLIERAKTTLPFVPDTEGRRAKMMSQVGLLGGPPEVWTENPDTNVLARLRRLKEAPSVVDLVTRSIRRRRRNANSMRDEKRSWSTAAMPEKYLFCELQSQPNATTSLKGWMYPDQRESVAMIAAHLPSGWKLVVKESNRQWIRMYPRRVNFWSQLAAIPNVHVVPSFSDSSSLLRGSAGLVETSYSNLALKAVQQGIPVIALGYTHIAGLVGVRTVTTDEQARVAVRETCLNAGARADEKAITESLQMFLDRKIAASIEGTLSYIPKFESDSQRSEYLHRVVTNVSSVIIAWVSLRVRSTTHQ